MRLWGLRNGDRLQEVALRTRDEIRLWAAQRMMSARDYDKAMALGRDHHDRMMELWSKVQVNHPKARIVRVTISE